ncbi:MAG: YcxB family protein [Pseudomonadota bacterium]
MEIEYRQTAADYYNAVKHINRRLHGASQWRYFLLMAFVVVVILFFWGAILIGDFYEKNSLVDLSELNFAFIVMTLGSIIFCASILYYNAKIKPLIFKEGGLYLSTHKFLIKQEHLLHTMGDNQHIYQWKYVQDIEKTKDYIFIFIDHAAALYIPRHGFSSDEEYDEFNERVRLFAVGNE